MIKNIGSKVRKVEASIYFKNKNVYGFGFMQSFYMHNGGEMVVCCYNELFGRWWS